MTTVARVSLRESTKNSIEEFSKHLTEASSYLVVETHFLVRVVFYSRFSNAFELMNEHIWFPGGLVFGNRFLTDGLYQNEVANDSCPA
jgi:hypothetical protein|tara:strand:- start:245 stop:508 length:264 start_codon:yes stop_codon:yes gene_type:complete